MHKAIVILLTNAVFAALALGQMAPVNPTNDFFNQPDFKKRFLGSYGFLSGREPQLKPEDAEVLEELQPLLNSPQQAANFLQAELANQASPNAAFIYTLANLQAQIGEESKAVDNYERAIQAFPDFLRAHKNLGLLFLRRESLEDAKKSLTKAIELGDTDGKTFGLVAYIYENQEKYLAAESAYRRALVEEPDSKDWKVGLARSLLIQEKFTEAVAILDELIRENPSNDQFWLLQANAFLGLEQAVRAASNYEVLRRMGKATPDSLKLLGDIYVNLEMIELAAEAYLAAIEGGKQPSLAGIIKAAETLTNFEAFTDAEELLDGIRKVYSSIPQREDLELLTIRSRIQLATGEADKAAATLQQIVDTDPTRGRAQISLADYFIQQADEVDSALDNADDLRLTFFNKAKQRLAFAANLKGFEREALLKHAQVFIKEKKYGEAVDKLTAAQAIKFEDRIQDFLEKVERAYRAQQAQEQAG